MVSLSAGDGAPPKSAVFPSTALAYLFLLPVSLALAAFWIPALKIPILIFDFLIAVVALADLVASRGGRFVLTRSYRDILSVGKSNAFDVTLTWHGLRTIQAQLRADLPAHWQCPEFPLKTVLKPEEPATLRHHLIPQSRGDATLGDHFIRFPTRWGLWIREERYPAHEKLKVYPDLATIRSYELLSRKHRQYALVRASSLRGGESEFSRLRDYTKDDNYRFVDWKATARRGKLTAREYQLESDQNIVLVLDAGRLMTAETRGLAQFDHALNACLLLAHVAGRGGDRVGLLCFDERVKLFMPVQAGPQTSQRIAQQTYSLHPSLTDSSFATGLAPLHSRLRQRSLIVLFTQLSDDSAVHELAVQVRLLAKKHLVLIVVLEDADLTACMGDAGDTSSGRDLYDKGAAAELLSWKARALEVLRQNGALLIGVDASELTPRLINRYLDLKARRAL